MQIKNIFILSIISIALLTGCSFTQEKRSKSPHFDGVIKFSNNAINNARIMLSTESDDIQCLKAKKFTTTDAQGKFSLKAITEDSSFTPFVNYTLDEWNICVEYQGNTYSLYSNNRYGSGNVTGSIYLECELALRPVNKPCIISH